MATSSIGADIRDYDKFPLSQAYYEKKDKLGERSKVNKSAKAAKKTLETRVVASSSSSFTLSASSSSSNSDNLISKVSQSILSDSGADNGTESLNLLQGLQSYPDSVNKLALCFSGDKVTSVETEPVESVDWSWLESDELLFLRNIFKTYALNDTISVYHVLSFHLYNLLESVKKEIPSRAREKFEKEVIDEFTYRYLVLSSTIIAQYCKKIDSSPINSELEVLDGRYFVKESNIPSYFDPIENHLDALAKLSENEKPPVSKPGKSTQERLQSKLQKKPSKPLDITQVNACFALFKRFLNKSKGEPLLEIIRSFPDGALIKKGAEQTRDDLIKWINFLKKASSTLADRTGITNNTPIFYKTALRHLPNLIIANRSIRHASLVAIYKTLKDILVASDDYIPKVKLLLQQPALRMDDPMRLSKCYLEYEHSILFRNVSLTVYNMTNGYIPNLLEKNYVSTHHIINRLVLNAFLICSKDSPFRKPPKEMPSKSFPLSHDLRLFQDCLQENLAPLLTNLRLQITEGALKEPFDIMSETLSSRSGKFAEDLVFWPDFIQKLKPLLAVQESLYSSLHEVREKALSELSCEEPLSEKERDAFNEVFFQGISPFFPLLFFMYDVQTFLEGNECEITREEQLIHPKMASLIIFDEQDFALGTKSDEENIPPPTPSRPKDDRAKSPEPTSSESPSKLPEKPVRGPERLTRKEVRALENLSVRETLRETPLIPIEELSIRTVNKTRKLLKLLKQAGYMPKPKNEGKGRGSHRVLKNDTGKITVVPKGNKKKGIKKGTLLSIEHQAGENGSKTATIGHGRKKHKKGKKSSSLGPIDIT
jgi:predicted RNA binding protein YcfA (HicA-like mRNA interferase family)